jgi:peptide/nickel transport system substrate-binding protein
MKIRRDSLGRLDWDVADWDGKKFNPNKMLKDMVYMPDAKQRQYWIDRLVWVANEYCFGINLFQNVNGNFFNRAMVKNLPDEDRVDEYHQWMPIYTEGDLKQKSVELSESFGGFSLLYWLEPRVKP